MDLHLTDEQTTKVELETKPGKGFLVGAIAVLLAAYAAGLAGTAIAQQQREPPYSCRLYYDEQKKCAFGSCDARVIERLKRECLRDGGRP